MTFDYELRLNKKTKIYEGTYTIVGGTGALDDATGFGLIVAEQGTTGQFFLLGILTPDEEGPDASGGWQRPERMIPSFASSVL